MRLLTGCVLTVAGHCAVSGDTAVNQTDTILSYGVGILVRWDGRSAQHIAYNIPGFDKCYKE